MDTASQQRRSSPFTILSAPPQPPEKEEEALPAYPLYDRPRPAVRAVEADGRHYVYNPSASKIFKIDSALLASLIGLPLDLSPEELRALEPFQGLSLAKCQEALAAYRELAAAELETELAPELRNDFDTPGFFEHFSTSISHFSLIPTHQCNMRCTYCAYTGTYLEQRPHEDVNVEDRVVDRAVEFVLKASARSPKVDVNVYGGEALIGWDAVRKFHRGLKESLPAGKQFYFLIATNGLLLRPSILEYCVENGIRIQVSLDGPQPIHDRYRVSMAGGQTFTQIFGNLKRLYAQAPDYFRRCISLSAVYGPPYRIEEADAWFREQEMFEHHGFRNANFTLGHINTTDTSFFDSMPDYETDWRRATERQREIYLDSLARDDYKSVRFFPATLYERLLKKFISRLVHGRSPASQPWDRPDCIPGEMVAIDPNGDLYICVQTTNFIPIGNVWDGFDAASMHKTRQMFVDKKNSNCRGCWAYKHCDMCLSTMRRGKVVHNVTYSKNCEKTRNKLTSALEMYCDLLQRAPDALGKVMSATV
jgi:uncharacterized protein